MIGSFLTRGLVTLFGYAYPAYECFKTVEMNKPDIEQLRFWCQYWILVAILTVFERFGDNFISWVPMYSEAKLAFVIFLWCPKTKGTAYVYDSFFRPYMAKHETEIDRNLLELRTRAGEMAVIYCQKAASYGQTRIFDVLQYIAAQSAPRPPPAQVPRPARQHSTRSQHSQQSNDEPPSPASSTSSTPQVKEVGPELSSTQGQSTLAPVTSTPIPSAPAIGLTPVKKSVSMPAAPESSSQLTDDVDEMQIEPVPAIVEKAVPNAPPPPQEIVMEEAIRVTRGRLRSTRPTVTK